MKILFKISMITLILVACISCSDDNGDESIQEVQFIGEWLGTYSGLDSGFWNITVSRIGEVTGEGFSKNAMQTLTVEGNVDVSGDFRAIIGATNNEIIFTGTFTENSSSGVWENTTLGITGTWEGVRNENIN